MSKTAVNRRSEERQRKVLGPQLEMTVVGSTPPRRVRGRVTDVSPGGFGIACSDSLETGSKVAFFDPVTSEQREGRVAWCRPNPPGDFKAGISFKPPAAQGEAGSADARVEVNENEPDYYEVLQVNPKAEPDTIHRIYRLLAQRLHPDNQETGNDAEFRGVLKAYRLLSDPEQRAAYDLRLRALQKERLKLAHAAGEHQNPRTEKDKRNAILALLYAKRVQDPRSPGVQLPEFEEVIGVPREHLEFSMWYLRERGFLARSDNGRFAITVSGVDEVEQAQSDAAVEAETGEWSTAKAINRLPKSRRLESASGPEAR